MNKYQKPRTELKNKIDHILDTVKPVLDKSEETKFSQELLDSLEESLVEYSSGNTDSLEELSESIKSLFSSLNIEENYEDLSVTLQDLWKQSEESSNSIEESLDKLTQILIQALSEDEEALWETRRQEYKQSAKESIAKSFKALNIPSFSAGDLIIDPKQKEESSSS